MFENLTKYQLRDQKRSDEINIEKILNWEKNPTMKNNCLIGLQTRIEMCDKLIFAMTL